MQKGKILKKSCFPAAQTGDQRRVGLGCGAAAGEAELGVEGTAGLS